MADVKNKGRRRRLLVMTLGGLVLVLLIGIAMAPTLINWGVGRGAIISAIESNVNGSVSIERLRLGWFGPQRVEGFKVVEVGGREAVDVNASINSSLFSLIGGSELDVDVSGTIRSDLREDNSLGIMDLVKKPAPTAAPPPKPEDGPLTIGAPPTTVRVSDLRIELNDLTAGGAYILSGMTGNIAFRPGDAVRGELKATAQQGAQTGSLEARLESTGLFNSQGVLTPKGASIDGSVHLVGVPLPRAPHVEKVEELTATLKSSDLARNLNVEAHARTMLAQGGVSTFDATVQADQPFTPNGKVNISPDRLTGTISGKDVPTALLDQVLAELPIDPQRDFGALMNIDATFSEGERKDVKVVVASDVLDVRLEGVVDATNQSLTGSLLHVGTKIHPQLLAEMTDQQFKAESAVPVVIDLDQFSIPPVKDGSINMMDLSLSGRATIEGSVGLVGAVDGRPAIALNGAEFNIATPRLGDAIKLVGSADVTGGRIEVDQQITDLFQADGSIDVTNVNPVGTVKATGIQPEMIASFVPEQANLIRAIVQAPLEVNVVTAGGELPTATVDAKAKGLLFHTVATRTAGGIGVRDTSMYLTLVPALFEAVLPQEDGIRLHAQTTFNATVEPLVLPVNNEGEYGMPTNPVTANIKLGGAEFINVPGLANPVRTEAFDINAAVTAGDVMQIGVTGDVRLLDMSQRQTIANVRIDDVLVRQVGESWAPSGRINLRDVQIPALERVLGMEPETLAGWVGPTGAMQVEMASGSDGGESTYQLTADLTRFNGDLRVVDQQDAWLVTTTKQASLKLQAKVLEAMINPKAATEAGGRVTVGSEVPIAMDIHTLRVAKSVLGDQPVITPGSMQADVDLTAGTLRLTDSKQRVSELSDIELHVKTEDLAAGVEFALAGYTTLVSANNTGAVPLNISGSARKLVDAQNRLDLLGAALTLDGKAADVPTALLDGLLDLNGLLIAAVGPQMTVDLNAKNFSKTSGTLGAKVVTTNGWLEGNATGGQDALRIAADAPLKAELAITKPLRDQLLRNIHPIFSDVRSTEHPVKMAFGNAVLPTNGDTKKLQADFSIDVGAVELDRGSLILLVMDLTDRGTRTTVPGSIEEIKGRIRNGIVTYDRFEMHLDKYTLAYTGTIDLNKRTLDLRTEVPLEGLAMSIEELRGYADKITVPIKTHGSLDAPKTEVDPSFDVGKAALEAGFQGAIGDLLGEQGIEGGIDDLLKDLFNRKKKK